MINCIGGVQVLFPWLEHVGKCPIKSDKRISIAPSSGLQSEIYKNLQDDWVVVQSATYTGTVICLPQIFCWSESGRKKNASKIHVLLFCGKIREFLIFLGDLHCILKMRMCLAGFYLSVSETHFFHTDNALEANQVAGFLTLLRNFVQSTPANQDSLVRTNAMGTLSYMLQKVLSSQKDKKTNIGKLGCDFSTIKKAFSSPNLV